MVRDLLGDAFDAFFSWYYDKPYSWEAGGVLVTDAQGKVQEGLLELEEDGKPLSYVGALHVVDPNDPYCLNCECYCCTYCVPSGVQPPPPTPHPPPLTHHHHHLLWASSI